MKRSSILMLILVFTVAAFSQGLSPQALSKRVSSMWTEINAMGLPAIRGQYIYVDPTSGNVNWDGTTPATAVKSIVTAYAKVRDGAGDGIVLLSRGSTSAATTSYLTEKWTLAKSCLTIVGLAAPVSKFGRARIANNSGNRMDYLIDVTGSNIAFYNIDMFNVADSSASAHGSLKLSGQRIYLDNCFIAAAPGSATANCWDLYLNGCQDVDIVGGSIGSDTWDRGANASGLILVHGQVYRVEFSHIMTRTFISTGTAASVVKCDASGSLNNDIVFRDECGFIARTSNSTKPALASWFIGTSPATGQIILSPTCFNVGYAAWDAVGGNDRVFVTAPVPTAATSGIGIAP